MGQSAILVIEELAQSQEQAYTVVNDMLAALEGAHNGLKTITTTGAYVMPVLEFTRFRVFSFTGATADANLTFPSTVVGSNAANRVVTVINKSALYSRTIVGSSGTSIVVPPLSSATVHVQGSTLNLLSQAGVITSVPHTTAFFTAGAPGGDTEVLRYVFTEKVTWAALLAGFGGSVQIAPSPSGYFYIYRNGTRVAIIQVTAGGSFICIEGAGTTWAVGDVLTVRYQTLEVGTITFNSVADTNDEVTLDDGTNTPVTFTFGGGGGQVPPGSNPTDSATNLKAAIEASALASSFIVQRNGGILTIINLLVAGTGAITKSDADNDFTVVDFTTDSTGQYFGVTFKGTRS